MTDVFARTLTVYLVNAHPIAREGLAHAIDEAGGLFVVGQAGTAAGALAETKTAQPDVVLIHLDLPDRDGIELVGALRAELPGAWLLILTASNEALRVGEALQAGADGYLFKAARVEEIIEKIRRIVGSCAPLDAGIERASDLVRAGGDEPGSRAEGGLEALTAREWEVLRLLLLRKTTREIGKRLDLDRGAVETHAARVHAKLGRSSIEELAAVARRWRKPGEPPAAASAMALGPGPRPPSLVDAMAEPDD